MNLLLAILLLTGMPQDRAQSPQEASVSVRLGSGVTFAPERLKTPVNASKGHITTLAWGWRPSRPSLPTIASFGLRAADTAQTCWLMAGEPMRRERMWPGIGRSCARLSLVSFGMAALAWQGDRLLTRHNHPRLGRALQWISAGGAVQGIVYSSTHPVRQGAPAAVNGPVKMQAY